MAITRTRQISYRKREQLGYDNKIAKEEVSKMYQILAEHLKQQSEDGLPQGYYRVLYDQWERMSREEREEMIEKNHPQLVAKIVFLMLGEPGHNVQPQNRLKYNFFEVVIRNNPQALVNHNSQGEPIWMEAVMRFNLHEDGTTVRAMQRIGEIMYEGHEKQVWRKHCDTVLRRMNPTRPEYRRARVFKVPEREKSENNEG